MFVAKLGSVPTATEDLSNTGEFVIFPNPNNGKFTLATSGTTHSIDIYSISGVKVFNMNNINSQMNTEINLTSFYPGIYLLKANVGGKQYSRKLIIRKNQ